MHFDHWAKKNVVRLDLDCISSEYVLSVRLQCVCTQDISIEYLLT